MITCFLTSESALHSLRISSHCYWTYDCAASVGNLRKSTHGYILRCCIICLSAPHNVMPRLSTGTIPSSFANLISITKLWIDNNRFRGARTLTYRSVSSRRHIMSSINPGSMPFFMSWTQLATFTVYGNAFTGSIPNSIGLMTALTNLHLGTNCFTGNRFEL